MSATITALKDHELKGMKSELMPMAAVLGFVDASPEDKAKDIKEISDYLKEQKGFKWFSGGTQRSLYSILAYVLENIKEDSAALNSVINTTLTNIIIEEIILITVVVVAANTASSSGAN